MVDERSYQVAKWGLRTDRDVNTPMDFVGYICSHATRWFGGGFRPYSRKTLTDFVAAMVKVATLAMVAATEAQAILDGENDRPDVLAQD